MSVDPDFDDIDPRELPRPCSLEARFAHLEAV